MAQLPLFRGEKVTYVSEVTQTSQKLDYGTTSTLKSIINIENAKYKYFVKITAI